MKRSETRRQRRIMEILRNSIKMSNMTSIQKHMFDLLLVVYFQGSTTCRGENAADAFTADAIKRRYIERAPIDRIDFSKPVELVPMVQKDSRHLDILEGASTLVLQLSDKLFAREPWSSSFERDGNMQSVSENSKGQSLVSAWYTIDRFEELLELSPLYRMTESLVQHIASTTKTWRTAGAQFVMFEAVETSKKR